MTHSLPAVSAESLDSHSRKTAGRWEQLLVGLFCLLAAVRVFLFTAAFPFFNYVDEQYHFDLVCRYSHGDIPPGVQPFSLEAAELIALYGSPEYLQDLGNLPAEKVASPVWASPARVRAKLLRQRTDIWKSKENHEAVQPPVYYAIVAGWHSLGKSLGIEGGKLLYWMRFFNVPMYAVLVWLSYLLAKEFFPASKFVYLSVPCLLVVFPQDVFYNVNNDVLSAPLVTLALYLLFRMYRIDAPRPGLTLCAGLTTAAAVLTKFTNAPILVIAGIVAVLKLRLAWREQWSRRQLAPVMLLLLAAAIPVGCWLARNYVCMGELTGFAAKSRSLNWTPKPLGQYGNHPIFTPGGFLAFWSALLTTFWRGEGLWHGHPMAAGHVDTFYVTSTTLCLLAFLIAAVAGRAKADVATWWASVFCLLMLALSLAIMIFCSVSVDFGNCFYPSRRWPYFSSGRLILASLVPLLIMYLSGLESLLGWLRFSFLRLPLLIIAVDLMAIAAIVYSLDVFASQYNWFHLP
jgi:hypothetical protein